MSLRHGVLAFLALTAGTGAAEIAVTRLDDRHRPSARRTTIRCVRRSFTQRGVLRTAPCDVGAGDGIDDATIAEGFD